MDAKLISNVRRMVMMLVVMFVAGMALNVLGGADSDVAGFKKVAVIAVGLIHVIVGIGLVLVSIQLFRASAKINDSYIKAKLKYGMYDIMFAFGFGILTVAVTKLTDLFSFLMALSFLAGFITYGSLYLKLGTKEPN
ncbi:MAG TPA: hypothetical protein VLE72_02855 [Candidatus Saccharimonadales bacterium]|nr:hypothetical protein [Candidatus Saccharimonadales bacterium]